MTGRTRRGTVSLPGRGAVGSLVDELRTAPPASAATTAPVPSAAPATVTSVPLAPLGTPATAPPPPKKRRQSREQFSTKLPPMLIQDLRTFCEHHQAEIQVVVELALGEYLASRGWETSA